MECEESLIGITLQRGGLWGPPPERRGLDEDAGTNPDHRPKSLVEDELEIGAELGKVGNPPFRVS